ncbi:sulfatase-like hydrolase/transferase [Flammeovirga kamogawensis]|uniref:Sulfatase-like hydrolase/transferase n=1 Tax=Flammeovirga kamogawensis TaxID=373891 RepID=A0ABX8H2G2_9BACT|nr:sulfatase-like hydrolase/transferase [Flammeovirga kamogawensis]MBB6463268.1 putative outer membrane repeat protein [Flammeovirga kamogawensis]QWG09582.1 sulfatase-like hydrolase/transferase [Flammeovirga kamogawensis]TRX65097.1 sulfatase-like hydrolase/transferase [Flammeovirga kamogawensis]
MKKLLLFTINLILLSTSLTFATTWYVSTTGENSNNGELSTPFLTIDYALSIAADDDTIHILGTITESQIMITKSITIEGDSPSTSIVQSDNISAIELLAGVNPPTLVSNSRIFTINTVGINVRFKNLTIQNSVDLGQGGAIINNKSASVLEIESCNFINNYSANSGGAIATNQELSIKNSSFIGNESASHSGAVNNNSGGYPLTIENSLFSGNKASGTGTGGAVRTNSQNVSLVNNTFVNNSTSAVNKVEGVNFFGSTGTINLYNNIFFNNKGESDDRADGEDLSISTTGTITVNARANIISYIHASTTRGLFTGNNNLLQSANVTADLIKFGPLQQAQNGLYVLPIYPSSIGDNTGDETNGTLEDALGFVKTNYDRGHLSIGSTPIAPIFITDKYQNYPENQEALTLKTLSASNAVSFEIIGGEDQNAFTIDNNGDLSFNTQPQLGIPNDTDNDNVYKVEVKITEGNLSSTQLFELSIVGAKLNVVMIVLDDLNDYAGFMGGHLQTKTPNIDRLASQGVSFMNAHSNAPLCDPSRASFLNGILPITSQHFGTGNSNWKNNVVLKESKLISEYFMDNGYTTYKTGKITHSTSGENSWWDYVHENSHDYGPLAYNGVGGAVHQNSVHQMHDAGGSLDGVYGRLSDIPRVRTHSSLQNASRYTEGWFSTTSKTAFRYVTEEDRDLMPDEKNVAWTAANIKALNDMDSDDPFFMAVGIIRPHSPFVVPDKYFDMFPLEEVQLPEIFLDDRDDFTYDRSSRGHEIVDVLEHSHIDKNEGLKRYLQGYMASVAFADEMVGRVMTAVENSKFANNTIIMLYSDHGYNMGEKDYSHKNNLWEHGTRVPLIIKSPLFKATSGQKVDHPVSLVDIYPTLQDMCYLTGDTKHSALGADLDGHSLKPFLMDVNSQDFEGDEVAFSCIGNWFFKTKSHQNYGIKSKRFRYNNYADGQDELFDHLYDQNEFINVIDHPAYAEVKAAFDQKLKNKLHSEILLQDELSSTDNAFETSGNLGKANVSWGNAYVHDNTLLQRNAAGDAFLTYEVNNPGDINIEIWAPLITVDGKKVPNDIGTLKVYASSDNLTWNEVLTTEILGNYTWDSNILTYQNANEFPQNTNFVKVVLEGDGAGYNLALLGKVEIFSKEDRNIIMNLDDLTVDVDPSIFDIDPNRMRTSEAILPVVADDFSSDNIYYQKSNNNYLTNDSGNSFHNDKYRFVKSGAEAFITYEVDDVSGIRVEVVQHHSGTNIVNSDTVLTDAAVELYTSSDNITFTKVATRSVSLFIEDIINNEGQANEAIDLYRHSHKFAIISDQDLSQETKYVKVVLKSENDWGTQLSGVYIYGQNNGGGTIKQDQVIAIEPIEDKTVTAADFDILATTTSGLPLSYTVSGPVVLEGTTLSLTGETGEVSITVSQAGNGTFNAATESITFTVSALNITSISLSETDLQLNVGENHQLIANVLPAGIAAELMWSTDNPTVVEVNNQGVIEAISGGAATITVSTLDGTIYATATVISISDGVVSVPSIIEVTTTETTALVSFVESSNATYHRLEYKIDGKGWVEIDSVFNSAIDTYLLTDLIPESNYRFRMRGINSTRLSSWSPIVDFSTAGSNARKSSEVSSLENEISIYPNPIDNGFVTIVMQNSLTAFNVEVYNSIGQLHEIVKGKEVSNCKIDVTGWASGIYFMKIITDDFIETRRVIIK